MTAKIFIKNTNTISVVFSENSYDNLPKGYYKVGFHPLKGFYLIVTEELPVPPRLFGDVVNNTRYVMNSFKQLNKRMGIIASGVKGAGKTAFINNIAKTAVYEENMSVVTIDKDFTEAEGFTDFLCSLGDVVFIFDEFDKTHVQKAQEHMLSFFDGLSTNKVLNLISCNATFKLSEFLLNRTGRFRYHFKHASLRDDVVVEMLEANNLKEHSVEFLKAMKQYRLVTPDLVSAVIEESKLQNSVNFLELCKYLNIEQVSNSVILTIISAHSVLNPKENLLLKSEDYTMTVGNIQSFGFMVPIKKFTKNMEQDAYVLPYNDDDDDNESTYSERKNQMQVHVTSNHLKAVKGSKYIFETAGVVFTATAIEKSFESMDYLF